MTTSKPQNFIFLSKSLLLDVVNACWKRCSNFAEVPFYTVPEPYLQSFFPMVLVSHPECFVWTMKIKESGVLFLSLGVFEILCWAEDAQTYSRPAKEVRSWLHSESITLLWKGCFKAETVNSLFLRRLQKTHRFLFLKKGGGDGGPSLRPREDCIQHDHDIC